MANRPFTIPSTALRALAHRRGLTRDQVSESIVEERDGTITLDWAHPIWRTQPRTDRQRDTHTPQAFDDSLPRNPHDRWLMLGAWARQQVGDPVGEMQRIRGLARGLCTYCQQGWEKFCKFNLDDKVVKNPESYWRFRVDAQNYVNITRGVMPLSYEQAAAIEPIFVHNSATGLGDAISGLYAACGIADRVSRPLIYCTHSLIWINVASHPNLIMWPIERGAFGVDLCGGSVGYERQIGSATTRAQAYCDNVNEATGIEGLRPRRPLAVRTASPGMNRSAIFSPFSSYNCREWRPEKWADLARALFDKGFDVHAVGSASHADQLQKTFGNTRASWTYGESPETIADRIMAAGVVIGNDSGIVHFAGLLDTPTVAVHAGSLPHVFLYDCASAVDSVISGAAMDRSDNNPSALESISVEAVVAAAENAILSRAHPHDSDQRLVTLMTKTAGESFDYGNL